MYGRKDLRIWHNLTKIEREEFEQEVLKVLTRSTKFPTSNQLAAWMKPRLFTIYCGHSDCRDPEHVEYRKPWGPDVTDALNRLHKKGLVGKIQKARNQRNYWYAPPTEEERVLRTISAGKEPG